MFARSLIKTSFNAKVVFNRRVATGIVKFFDLAKGYGFITTNKIDEDIFVHQSEIQTANVRTLKAGDHVKYNVKVHEQRGGKKFASNVTVFDSEKVKGTARPAQLKLKNRTMTWLSEALGNNAMDAFDIARRTYQERGFEVAENVLESLDEGGYEDGECEVFSLPEGRTFPLEYGIKRRPGYNKLYIRKSWKHIVEILNYVVTAGVIEGVIPAGVIVEGPPGDGKSHLAVYFLSEQIKQGRTVIYEDIDGDATWIFNPDGTSRRVCGRADCKSAPELYKEGAIHIHDASAGIPFPPIRSPAPLFLFRSKRQLQHKAAYNRGMITLTHLTPCLEEVLIANKVFGMSDEMKIFERYEKYGGSFHNLFARSENDVDYDIRLSAQKVARDIVKNPNMEIKWHDAAFSGLYSTHLCDKAHASIFELEQNEDHVKMTEAQRVHILYKAYNHGSVEWRVASGYIKNLLVQNTKSMEEKMRLLGQASRDCSTK